jgi:hypothetical protein
MEGVKSIDQTEVFLSYNLDFTGFLSIIGGLLSKAVISKVL